MRRASLRMLIFLKHDDESEKQRVETVSDLSTGIDADWYWHCYQQPKASLCLYGKKGQKTCSTVFV